MYVQSMNTKSILNIFLLFIWILTFASLRAENIDIEGFIRISRNYEELIKENYEDF